MKKMISKNIVRLLACGLAGLPLLAGAATYTVTTNAGTGAGSLWQADSEAE